MLRLVLEWVNTPWAFELHPGLNKLGRNPTNDFRVTDPSISSFHAELFIEGDSVRVRDLGSTNGTFIDGERIEEGLLTPEKVLRLGNAEFKLDEVVVGSMPTATAPKGEASATAAPAFDRKWGYHPE